MHVALNTAATGMDAMQRKVDVEAHNISNSATNGFKRMRPQFVDLLYQNYRLPGMTADELGNIAPGGLQYGTGVKTAAVYTINTQGGLDQTEATYDSAIIGRGYYQISMPDGTINYTRDGSFRLDNNGRIVTNEGLPIEPEITVPDNAISVTIAANGLVTAKIPGQVEPEELGTIQIATFINPNGLQRVGKNLLQQTQASGDPIVGDPNSDQFGYLMQGFVEASNVSPVESITTLIKAQRAYEMNSKTVTTADEMYKTTVQLG